MATIEDHDDTNKPSIRAMRKEKLAKSDRMCDILQNKLTERNNVRGNIIFNSLGDHRRTFTKHRDSSTPVADPKVYSILGKLH